MALDLTILDDAGYPREGVQIGMHTHYKIIQHAAAAGHYPLILKMSDYFEDANYGAEEVEPLLNELLRLEQAFVSESDSPVDPEVVTTLRKMEDLCRRALGEQRPVVTISD